MNILKTAFLLTLLTLILVFIGNLIGGQQGMLIALIFAGVMNFVSYWFSDKIVLGIYRAKKVTETEAPELVSLVRRTAQKAGLPLPKVYLIPTDTPNAFATGRNPSHSAVAVTEGILRILDQDELEGVIAHELAHVRNRDILIASVVATVAGAISMLAYMAQWAAIFGGRDRDRNIFGLLIMAIVAPLAAMLIQMAISRSREFQADETGAKISRKPLGLANALKKLHATNLKLPLNANPSTAHMFIVNPLSGKGLVTLFSTHPPVGERIKRLEELSRHII